PRYPYTVANIDSIVKAAPGRSYVAGYQNSGYFIQKYAPLQQYVNPNAQPELNFPNDYIEIRLADVYLMEAEALVRGGGSASTAQSYLDKVRARVGLPSVPATLDNIYNERKLELATEGHRWYDLVRTGKAASALAFKGFTAGKNELMPIPLPELNNTKLVQNPGY
ncbi:MAG: RagB/SusD family nutrient uptake outer membrane protein, partial [Bacteroidota bacterium]|nr:RagB/SusD family nutrient uptake outer membrane protein [Bacteroidota bacterium]